VSRHDYLPFGEELGTVGMRTSGQGYGSADAARQKYAGMESDDGSGMATTLWRKYDSSSGRWTSPDPYTASMTIANPQSFNRYSYVGNDPVDMMDPSGLMTQAGQPDPEIPAPDEPPGGDPPDPPGDPFETGSIAAAESRQESAIRDRQSELANAPPSNGTQGDDTGGADSPAGGEPQHDQAGAGGVRSETVLEKIPEYGLDQIGIWRYWTDQQPIYGGGGCAEFVQIMAEKEGRDLGLAGHGRWRAGASVMGNKKLKRGTVIASGWMDGYYPNYSVSGCHTAIFLGFIDGGFRVLEQSGLVGHKHITIHDVVLKKDTYFENPYQYRVVEVGPPVKGIPESRGARP
jgi:RHS repeat-associated protein